jgi:predicted nucleotidyltransferase
MTLEILVEQLKAAFGSALRAVVLYGSAAAGEHIANRSDYNVLVIVDSLDLDLLRKEAAVARAWAEAGNPAPLTLTTREWQSSVDIFPMEYADVLERHRVLYGTPPFEGITVDRGDLRLQLEQQAMGKLLRLRAGIVAARGDSRQLVELLASSL